MPRSARLRVRGGATAHALLPQRNVSGGDACCAGECSTSGRFTSLHLSAFTFTAALLTPSHYHSSPAGTAGGSTSRALHPEQQRQQHQQQQWPRLPLLLASLSSSSQAAAAVRGGGPIQPQRQGQQQQGQGQQHGQQQGQQQHAPQLHISGVGSGIPADFAAEQIIAQRVMTFHLERNGAFPRPCPRCGSNDFMTLQPSPPSSASTSTSSGAVVDFGSRPLRCEQCQRWSHLRCLGCSAVEQVPRQPWFCCKSCRRQNAQLEAIASHGPVPLPRSPSLTTELSTPTDFTLTLMGVEGRGSLDEVYGILGKAFEPGVMAGYGDPNSEYDGGRYALLLRDDGDPVCACMFNVFGPDQPAQLNLVATSEKCRRRGHCREMLRALQSTLSRVGVQRLLVQPQRKALDMWVSSLGFSVAHPQYVAQLHTSLPLAYFDSVVLEKGTRSGAADAGAAGGQR